MRAAGKWKISAAFNYSLKFIDELTDVGERGGPGGRQSPVVSVRQEPSCPERADGQRALGRGKKTAGPGGVHYESGQRQRATKL
jgi:hypothetical protein